MKTIHIVSFNIPYPANYGGVIDVYYKLKALKNAGVKVILHCLVYNRPPAKELESLCEKVYYYQRRTGFWVNFRWSPYIVESRKNPELLENLAKDNHPVLFEGLHCCGFIDHLRLKDKLKIYRESNIEHEYYFQLAKAERNPGKKIFFYTESFRLKSFEKKLRFADVMLVVSREDYTYLKRKFPENRVEYLPSFHPNEEVKVLNGKGDFVLYHGNLSVSENYEAVIFLVENVFSKLRVPFVVAGMDPPDFLREVCSKYGHVKLIENPSETEMEGLVAEAQVNLLFTHQATGLKLKLLNVLYQGRHCLVNDKMLAGTGLDSCCEIANTPGEIIQKIKELMETEISEKDIEKRRTILKENFDNEMNVGKLVLLI